MGLSTAEAGINSNRYHVLVEKTPVCIHEINLEGELISMNAAGLRMINVGDESSIIGLKYVDAVSEKDRTRIRELLNRAIAEGLESHFEFTASVALNARIFSSCFIPINDSDGKILRVMGISQDITEQKRAEKELKTANEELLAANEKLWELDRLKTEFLATVSHELRTPLSATGGAVENFVRLFSHELNGKQKRLAEIMTRNITRLGRLIDNILDLSQIEAGRFSLERIDIDLRRPVGLTVESLRGMAEEAGRRLSYVEPEERMIAHADPDRVIQIVTNLIDNAIRFAKRDIRVSLTCEGQLVTIAVENDGVGFAPDRAGLFFERFAGARNGSDPGHLGLGLSIVKALASAHGGETLAENLPPPDKGVRFIVRMPSAAPPPVDSNP